MGEAGEVLVVVLLDHVDHEGGEDEDEEADIEGGDELLPVGVHHGAQQFPGPAPTVHANHPEYLEEPETSQSRGGVDPASQAREDDQGGTDGDHVDHAEGTLHEVQSSQPALKPAATASGPKPGSSRSSNLARTVQGSLREIIKLYNANSWLQSNHFAFNLQRREFIFISLKK